MEQNASSLDFSAFIELYTFMNQLVFHDLESELADLKLSKMELLIVLIVTTKEGLTMTELAQQVGTNKVQISRWVAQLEARNILQRQHNQENKRIVNVFPTLEGKSLFQAKEQQVKDNIQQTLSILDQADSQKIEEHLSEVLAIFMNYKKLQFNQK